MKWTPEHDAVLKQGLKENKTYAEIGLTLGRSRKSVSGRVHTLNLPKRQYHAEGAAKTLGGLRALETMTPYVEPERPQGGCQWPHGDPKDPGFHMCGLPIVPHAFSPYCQRHLDRALTKVGREASKYPAPRPELRSDYR
ncbi:MAG: GcrA family cell cycle regulator [Geminicoccaceae bacterium]